MKNKKAYYIKDDHAGERNSLGVFVLIKDNEILFYCDEHATFWRKFEDVGNQFDSHSDLNLNDDREKTFSRCRAAKLSEMPTELRDLVSGEAELSGI